MRKAGSGSQALLWLLIAVVAAACMVVGLMIAGALHDARASKTSPQSPLPTTASTIAEAELPEADIKVAVEKRKKEERLAAMERQRQQERRQAQEEERRRADVPFDLKGDRLGMSLAAFKAKYARRVDGRNAPFCSDTLPGEKIGTLSSEPWHTRAGIVNCRIAFPFESRQGGAPTIGEVETILLLHHFVDGKLYRITALLPHDGYLKVKQGLIAKHGRPTQEQTNTFQNRMGATFPGESLVWRNGVSTIILEERCGDLDTSSLVLWHRELSTIVEARTPKPTGKDL